MQAVLHSSVAAVPMGSTAIALQVTRTLDAPFPCTVAAQTLEPQAGLAPLASPFPSLLPFTLQPQSTHLSHFSVSRDASHSAARIDELACQLHTTYRIDSSDLAALPVRAPTSDASAATDGTASPAYLPGDVSRCLLRSRTAPRSAANLATVDATQAQRLARSATEDAPAGTAAVCMHVHTFSVELSSFSALSLLNRSLTGDLGQHGGTGDTALQPQVEFMGPRRVVVGRDTALMWRLRWPCEECAETSGAMPNTELLPTGPLASGMAHK